MVLLGQSLEAVRDIKLNLTARLSRRLFACQKINQIYGHKWRGNLNYLWIIAHFPIRTHRAMAKPSKSEAAFEILVRQHHRRLLAYAISITGDPDVAPDIVQDAFVVAYENLEKFDAAKDFGAWMRGIVRNKSREWNRSRKLVTMDEEMLEVLEQKHRVWDNQEAESGIRIFSALQECLTKLPQVMGQAINLFYFQQLSGADIADRLGVGEAAVRKRLQRARTQLGECIAKQA